MLPKSPPSSSVVGTLLPMVEINLGCALAAGPGHGPWHLTCLFCRNHVLGTLDFTDSNHLAAFIFSYFTTSCQYFSISISLTLGTRGFSRMRWEFSVLAEGRHIFDLWHGAVLFTVPVDL